MKKLFGVLVLAVMSCMLLTSCVTTNPKAIKPAESQQHVEQLWNVDIIDKSQNYAFAIMCVVPLPQTEQSRCLFTPFAVYPNHMQKENGAATPSKFTIQLKSGDYEFLAIALDLRTNKQTQIQGRFSVGDGDGELIFREPPGMRVEGTQRGV